MGKMLLLLIVGMGMIVSIASLNIQQSNISMFTNAVNDFDETQARLYAESAIEFAIKQLLADTNYAGSQNLLFDNGSATITSQTTGAKVPDGPNVGMTSMRQLNATGIANDKSVTIKATVHLPRGGSGGGVPGFLNYAVATGQNLTLNGNILIRDDANPTVNANIHTNSNFQMNGVNTVKGFLTYSGNAHSNPEWRMNTAISPNVNPNSAPVHSQSAQIEIPDFNPDDYLGIATVIHNSNFTMSGNNTLGTKENPAIIYVGGDLNLSGNITGYAAFIVKGNVNISGNVNITTLDPTGNNLGLYTKGNVNVNGNVNVKAQILASQNVNLNGNVNVYGSVITKGVVNFNGNVDIFYRPATEELTAPFWEGSSTGNELLRPTIISYYE